MPFKSEKQRKWMHTNHPEMAKKWEKEKKVKKETKVKSLIKKMVREIMDEGKLIETVTKLTEKMTDKQIKQMRDKFMKTGKLPPHLKKLADLMDKHKDVKNVVVPGLEWMSDIKEGKLTEGFDLKKLEDAIKMFQQKIKKQGRVTNARDEEHLKKLIKVYKEMGGRKIKEGKLTEKAKRDYKAEYKKYGSSTKAKKYRAELNQYNRKKGTYGNGDGKDASHKGGKIVGFEKESVNRGRAEKSRLKKEGKLTEGGKEIAQTILQQLGGNKFIAMTGAKNLGFTGKGISMKIGKNAKGVTHVTIDLDRGKDLYNIEFIKIRGPKRTTIKKLKGIYADQLKKLFTQYTGLRVSL